MTATQIAIVATLWLAGAAVATAQTGPQFCNGDSLSPLASACSGYPQSAPQNGERNPDGSAGPRAQFPFDPFDLFHVVPRLKKHADDALADKTLGEGTRKYYETAEELGKATRDAEDQAFESLDNIISGKPVDFAEQDRLLQKRQRAAEEFRDAVPGAVRDGAEKAYSWPSKYGSRRLRDAGETGSRIDDARERINKTVERVERVYETGNKARKAYEDTEQIFRDAQENQLPVYEFRAGQGRVEVWLVGHEFPNGFVPLPNPQLVRTLPSGPLPTQTPTGPTPTAGHPRPGEVGYSVRQAMSATAREITRRCVVHAACRKALSERTCDFSWALASADAGARST